MNNVRIFKPLIFLRSLDGSPDGIQKGLIIDRLFEDGHGSHKYSTF
jgi:hypothetical protein